MEHFKALIPIVFIALLSACSGQNKEQKAAPEPFLDEILPVLMINEANTILYDEPSADGNVIANLPEVNYQALIGLSAVKDAENRVWYKCYYPKEQKEGWTNQVSHADFTENERHLPFLQNLTLAYLQLGANPADAKRLLGKPQSENSETGPLEASGYIDEDYIVTTTTMEYDGIQLVYEDDRMIHAYITKPGKNFGWIIIEDKNCDKDFLIEKFKLTQDDLFENEDGNKAFISMEILYIEVNFDENGLVKTIELNSGP